MDKDIQNRINEADKAYYDKFQESYPWHDYCNDDARSDNEKIAEIYDCIKRGTPKVREKVEYRASDGGIIIY